MIKLTRPNAPAELTAELVCSLTDEFKSDSKSQVWNKDFIRKSLIAMSNGKCCYCETKIDEESKYMEVEHFFCKSLYRDMVVEWSNLLPSCKRCNTQKGNHDVLMDGMIIDPAKDFPNHHIKMNSNYRFSGKDELGVRTIDTTYLNDTRRIVRKRFEIGNQICETLEKLHDDLKSCMKDIKSDKKIKKIIRSLTKILEEANPAEAFSATVATVILKN